jgi:predicted alpha-1,6-mannanase (GH76 family)
MKRFHGILICLLAALFLSSAGTPGASRSKNTATMSLLQKAHDGIVKLQSWYKHRTGLWRTTGWWNAANAVTVLVEYSRLSGASQYLSAVENTYKVNSGGGFINKYYDDEGWWALAWIAAYDQTGQKKYLKTSEHIFSNMKGGWNHTCGGGIWWSKHRHYKNAIANELFLSVAAELSARTTGRQHAVELNWANREWKWFSHSGMINSNHLINDGLNAACRNNGKTVWSYNQGVILGGLVALEKDTGNKSLLPTAQSIASAAISRLTDANGVLHDACEPHCGADGDQFKGIFTRNLAILYKADPQSQYLKFLRTNARSIWNKDAGPDDEFGLIWSGPDMAGNAATQTSAIDCLLAAAEVSPR